MVLVLRRLDLPHSCPQCLQCTWYTGQGIDTAHNTFSPPDDVYGQLSICWLNRRAAHYWHQIHQHLPCNAEPVFSESSCACLASQCKVECCSSIQRAQNPFHCQTRQSSQANNGQPKLWTLQCTYRRTRLRYLEQRRFQMCFPLYLADSQACTVELTECLDCGTLPDDTAMR